MRPTRSRWALLLLAAAAALGVAVVALAREQPGDDAVRLHVALQAEPAGGTAGEASVSRERAFAGRTSFLARTPGVAGGATQYARGVAHGLRWGAGSDVWYGCAFFLPRGFHAAQQGQVDLMRWDNFVLDRATTDRGGVVIYGGSDAGDAYLIRARLHGEQDELVGPFRIAEEAWHWLEVHQRFGPGGAGRSEVYLDGRLVGRSDAPNWYGRPATALRFGLVATGTQTVPLRLWFDEPELGRTSLREGTARTGGG